MNVWVFHVKEGCEDDFLRMNILDWPGLFGRSSDYKSTDVSIDTDGSGVYVTVDRWTSRAAFDSFCSQHRADYEKLDARHRKFVCV